MPREWSDENSEETFACAAYKAEESESQRKLKVFCGRIVFNVRG